MRVTADVKLASVQDVDIAVQAAKKAGEGGGSNGGGITKDQMERLIEKAAQTAPAQTIRIEQAPVQITQAPPKSDEPYKM